MSQRLTNVRLDFPVDQGLASGNQSKLPKTPCRRDVVIWVKLSDVHQRLISSRSGRPCRSHHRKALFVKPG